MPRKGFVAIPFLSDRSGAGPNIYMSRGLNKSGKESKVTFFGSGDRAIVLQ